MAKQSFSEFKRRAAICVPTFYNEGAFAALCMSSMIECPYPAYTYPYIEWIDGWIDTQEALCNFIFQYSKGSNFDA